MENVALMTWFHYKNFGTALQVVALYNSINKLGYRVDVVNYIPHSNVLTLHDNVLQYITSKIRNKFKNEIEGKFLKKEFLDERRPLLFDDFIKKHITLTDSCYTDSDLFRLNELYDIFVCGSDQIWASTCFNPKYFLNFVEDTNKMIAYAPSIGLSTIEDKYIIKNMGEYINRFRHLSIREEDGANLIKKFFGRDAEVVLDPTLLLTKQEWDNIVAPYKIDTPYILCYFLGNNKNNWEHVAKLKKEIGIPIKVIPIFPKDYKRKFDIVKNVGPEEFVNLVRNASFVCTDSFHGIIFSIIYQKPFYAYKRFSDSDNNSQNSRIYNILRILNLEDRLIVNKSKIENNLLSCDFSCTNDRLKIEKEKSLNYLERALSESSMGILKNNEYTITNTCAGCASCLAICKNEAIEIKRDEYGFLKAFINQSKCVKCGLCKKVCPYNGIHSVEINKEKHKLFMAYSKDMEVLHVSSSGGIGYEIAKLSCEYGYDVIGCTYDESKREAIHKRILANQIADLHIFQGSKYLQSNIIEAVRELTDNPQKSVIFGTPCEIAGIDRFLRLKKRRDDYVLVDLICHGVPSQNLWLKYIKEGSKRYKYSLTPKVDFRYKPKGWRKRYLRIEDNGKIYINSDKKDLFYRLFILGCCLMPACYECNYRVFSAADIRIGDYWGPRYKNDKNGVSMVITMTNKGEELLERLYKANRIELQQMNCEEYWTVQSPYNPVKPIFYKELMHDLKMDSISLKSLHNKYCKEYELYNRLYSIYYHVKNHI